MIFVRNVVQRGVEERVVVTEKTPFRIYKRIIREGERERERKRKKKRKKLQTLFAR